MVQLNRTLFVVVTPIASVGSIFIKMASRATRCIATAMLQRKSMPQYRSRNPSLASMTILAFQPKPIGVDERLGMAISTIGWRSLKNMIKMTTLAHGCGVLAI
jgi:hypothetical protein